MKQYINNHHLQAFFLRHLYPLKRDFDLLSDMIYWPIIDTLLWGITGQWLVDTSGNQSLISAILFGLVIWNIIWRAQSEVSRNLIDEIWNNNLVNLFSTPLTITEWIMGVTMLSILKTMVTLGVLAVAISVLYQIGIFQLSWWFLAFFAGATLTGWWMGFISAGVVLRYGPKYQTVVWTFPGILAPFSAIYFPVDKLPIWGQYISKVVPTSYILETMRSVLFGNGVSGQMLAISFVLNFCVFGFSTVVLCA